jgi:hypothetical protein
MRAVVQGQSAGAHVAMVSVGHERRVCCSRVLNGCPQVFFAQSVDNQSIDACRCATSCSSLLIVSMRQRAMSLLVAISSRVHLIIAHAKRARPRRRLQPTTPCPLADPGHSQQAALVCTLTFFRFEHFSIDPRFYAAGATVDPANATSGRDPQSARSDPPSGSSPDLC